MDKLRIRDSVAVRVDEIGDMATVSSNKHFSVREEYSADLKFDENTILTAFVWKSEAKAVAVSVSKDRFRQHAMRKTPEGHFACAMELAPGKYQFRFLVDGEWTVNRGDKNIVRGNDGNLYHEIIVSSEIAEESLNNEVLKDQVIGALREHKEELPVLSGKPPSKNAKGGSNILRKPFSLLGAKTSKVNSPEGIADRPVLPPQHDKNQKKKLINAEENARERQEVARAMIRRGNDDGGLALYNVAITIREENGLFYFPGNAHCHAEMAMVFLKLGELKFAEVHLRVALRSWNEAPSGNFNGEPPHRYGDMCHYLAVVLDKQQRHEEAAHLYKMAVKIYKQYAVEIDERRLNAAKENKKNNKKKIKKNSGSAPLSENQNSVAKPSDMKFPF